jgi:hypothetical protein
MRIVLVRFSWKKGRQAVGVAGLLCRRSSPAATTTTTTTIAYLYSSSISILFKALVLLLSCRSCWEGKKMARKGFYF